MIGVVGSRRVLMRPPQHSLEQARVVNGRFNGSAYVVVTAAMKQAGPRRHPWARYASVEAAIERDPNRERALRIALEIFDFTLPEAAPRVF